MLQPSGHGGTDPPVVTFTAVNIRKFVVRAKRLHDLVELGTLTTQAAAFLDACVVAGLNIIVAGGTWDAMKFAWMALISPLMVLKRRVASGHTSSAVSTTGFAADPV